MRCSLEGQISNIADRIAVNSHDLEDGMRAGLIENGQLEGIVIFTEAQQRIKAEVIKDRTIVRTRTAKAIIDTLVSDCIEASKKAIERANIKTVEQVYRCGEELIVLSGENDAKLSKLENFLFENFYMHATLRQTAKQVEKWLGELFEKLCEKPELMPGYFQRFIDAEGLQRTVVDYIAGMTDGFCLKMLKVKS